MSQPTARDRSAVPLANKLRAWSALFSEQKSELVKRYPAVLVAQGVTGEQDLAGIRRSMAQIDPHRTRLGAVARGA